MKAARPSPTAQQQLAIEARGNVLVVAGAGAGKTQTVVDRCLAWLLDAKKPGSIEQILMVTFTQAAAAEMRHRLRLGLEAAQATLPANSSQATHLAEQLALLDTAHIGTLHSFCYDLIRRHFYELALDPKTKILQEERSHLLERECLEAVLNEVYTGSDEEALTIQQFIQNLPGDWEAQTRELVLKVHHYAQTMRNHDEWLAQQRALLEQPVPEHWEKWLMAELPRWRDEWLEILAAHNDQNPNAAQCSKILRALNADASRLAYASALQEVLAVDANWPKGKKTALRKPMEEIFVEATFLLSVTAVGETDPLTDDWIWSRGTIRALLDLVARFEARYHRAKQTEGGIDFSDLEQFALRLLWRDGAGSAIARQWRRKFRLIFVDEYQDINPAQEAIISALGGEGAEANRFLVGDVKQSIYGFRLTDPRIFARYEEEWTPGETGKVVSLTENFRSHEAILQFVNALFTGLMRRETGGVEYNHATQLTFGNALGRQHLSAAAAANPPVELHLRIPTTAPADEDSSSEAEKEARLVGRQLMRIKAEPAPLFAKDGARRAAEWRDMVVLLRAPRGKVEAYVKEFALLGIPITATRGGFYESLEIRDLLNILHILDNPLQDLPLLGVLRSPLVGLKADDLAAIRMVEKKTRFWHALLQWKESTTKHDRVWERVREFLDRYTRWRQISRHKAVATCLETIIDETHYLDWLETQERGAQKQANVNRLLQMTRQFDADDGESVYRFLRFVEAQQESEVEIEPAAASEANAVRLMSIHQSKGLEFPIVAVADLGKKFNFSDAKSNVILDEEYGLAPKVHPPGAPQLYPSFPFWLARRRQRRQSLAEEMRLLYVALTRAEQKLLLIGSTREKAVDEKWPEMAGQPLAREEIFKANTYFDWIGPWLAREGDEWCQLVEHRGEEPVVRPTPAASEVSAGKLSAEQEEILAWHYPFEVETARAAKTSVTQLRRELAEEDGRETTLLFSNLSPRITGRLDATDTGLAHHAFLQWFDLTKADSIEHLKEEAERLGAEGLLTREQIEALNLMALKRFWESEVGQQFLAHSGKLHREFAFTARMTSGDLAEVGAKRIEKVGAAEFVIVQGVMDLAAILPKEIWVLDFKTDRFAPADLENKVATYRPQVALYALALKRIHQRPVTRRWLHFLSLNRTVELQ